MTPETSREPELQDAMQRLELRREFNRVSCYRSILPRPSSDTRWESSSDRHDND